MSRVKLFILGLCALIGLLVGYMAYGDRACAELPGSTLVHIPGTQDRACEVK